MSLSFHSSEMEGEDESQAADPNWWHVIWSKRHYDFSRYTLIPPQGSKCQYPSVITHTHQNTVWKISTFCGDWCVTEFKDDEMLSDFKILCDARVWGWWSCIQVLTLLEKFVQWGCVLSHPSREGLPVTIVEVSCFFWWRCESHVFVKLWAADTLPSDSLSQKVW